jgi:hypothetical protein
MLLTIGLLTITLLPVPKALVKQMRFITVTQLKSPLDN